MRKIVCLFWPGTQWINAEKKKALGERNVIMVCQCWRRWVSQIRSTKVENGKRILSPSSTTHLLEQRPLLQEPELRLFFGFFLVPPFGCFPPCIAGPLVRTPRMSAHNFIFLNLTLCFSKLKQMNIRWEEGTKDMVTGSRLSTSVRQLCTCLHLTPAKSPSGLLPHSCLYITPLPHPFLSQRFFLPTVEEILQPRLRWATAGSSAQCVILNIRMQPSRPGASCCKLKMGSIRRRLKWFKW